MYWIDLIDPLIFTLGGLRNFFEILETKCGCGFFVKGCHRFSFIYERPLYKSLKRSETDIEERKLFSSSEEIQFERFCKVTSKQFNQNVDTKLKQDLYTRKISFNRKKIEKTKI